MHWERDPECDVSVLYRPGRSYGSSQWTDLPFIRVAEVGGARTVKTFRPAGRYPIADVGDALFVTAPSRMVTQLQTRDNGIWRTWMVDEPGHWIMLQEAASQIKGPVVCVGGLGLGLIAYLLSLRPDIERIVVVEWNLDVIRLMTLAMSELNETPMANKVQLVHENFWDWVDMAPRYDSFFIDLWRGPVDENLDDVMRRDTQLADMYPRAQRLFFTFQRAIASRRALDTLL